MAAQQAGVPLSKVVVAIGDTQLPSGPMSGGSVATASLVPAVSRAAREARARLFEAAAGLTNGPFAKATADELMLTDGIVHRRGEPSTLGMPFEKVLRDARFRHVSGTGASPDSGADADAKSVSIHSYCAHFVEVGWHPDIARLRVRRVVTVVDGGTIINPRTAANQIEGAIMMGVGMALFEKTEYDPRSRRLHHCQQCGLAGHRCYLPRLSR
jgi:xanthine dehydrogenase YagR molybdenum-binding subunit